MVNRNALAASRPGSATVALSAAALLSPQAADAGFSRSQIGSRVHRGDLLRTQVNAVRRSTAGLRGGQTLATWTALVRQFDLLQLGWRVIAS